MRNEQGTVVYEELEIVTIIQSFYRKICRQEMPDTDDIVLFSSDHMEFTNMLKELKETSQAVGLQISLGRTKVMRPYNTQVVLDKINVETVVEYVDPGHKIKLRSKNQTMENGRRVRLTWAKYGNLSHILRRPKTPVNLKRKIFESCIIPVMTYDLDRTLGEGRNSQIWKRLQIISEDGLVM
ncbi:hypothetical protein HUJ04_003180 [Dendroctonus ponderosae]|nr:hypothetical protein HUJ04_003180 [Dendroctonus ponderosae]